MRCLPWTGSTCLGLALVVPAWSAEPAAPRTNYFPPPESTGGWRTLLAEKGDPDAGQKAKIRMLAGVDWDKLAAAWELNRSADGATGLLVIRRGYVVGE
jgi:hypothetical protein